MGITAAGTVPDSHRIPLHRGGINRLIAIYGCKNTNKKANYQIKSEIFGDFGVGEVIHLIDHAHGGVDDGIGAEGSRPFTKPEAEVE